MPKGIDTDISCDHLLCEISVAAHQRINRIGDLLFGEPTHLREQPSDLLQVDIESLGGMFLRCHLRNPAGDATRSGQVM